MNRWLVWWLKRHVDGQQWVLKNAKEDLSFTGNMLSDPLNHSNHILPWQNKIANIVLRQSKTVPGIYSVPVILVSLWNTFLSSDLNYAFFLQVHQANTCFISFFNTHFQFVSIVEVILLWEIKHVFHIFAAPGVFREKVKIQCGTYDTDTCARCNITVAL